MSQLLQDLRATHDLLESHGWCQGDFLNEDGKVCLDGALYLATGHGTVHPEAGIEIGTATPNYQRWVVARKAVEAQTSMPVWRWNDHPDRTVDEVRDALSRAIVSAEREEVNG